MTENKNIKSNSTVNCPNCGRTHNVGEYKVRNDKTISPNDFECCGTLWRIIVPLFKVTESGFAARQLHPNENVRN